MQHSILFDGFKYFEYNLEGMLKVINSIGIPVSNMEKAVTFYGETLGLKKKYDYSPDYVEFDCGGVGIGLEPIRHRLRILAFVHPILGFDA